MAKSKSSQQYPLESLAKFLPAGSVEDILYYLHKYSVELVVTKPRKSILGNYQLRPRLSTGAHIISEKHKITVNGDLNKYNFLITLIHELGHLIAFQRFGLKIMSHGREWQNTYSLLLHHFVQKEIFPPDITIELQKTIRRPSATTAGERTLMYLLSQYDHQTMSAKNLYLLQDIPINAAFVGEDGKTYQKGQILGNKIICKEQLSGQIIALPAYFKVSPTPKTNK